MKELRTIVGTNLKLESFDSLLVPKSQEAYGDDSHTGMPL